VRFNHMPPFLAKFNQNQDFETVKSLPADAVPLIAFRHVWRQ